MIVTVTQDDINRGVRQHNERCPIARALRRATGIRDISVGLQTVSFKSIWAAQLSYRVWEFIWDFDHGRYVRPFSFRIVNPRRYL